MSEDWGGVKRKAEEQGEPEESMYFLAMVKGVQPSRQKAEVWADEGVQQDLSSGQVLEAFLWGSLIPKHLLHRTRHPEKET